MLRKQLLNPFRWTQIPDLIACVEPRADAILRLDKGAQPTPAELPPDSAHL
jgi:hypothetical protein